MHGAHTRLGHRILLSSWPDVSFREIQAHVALHPELQEAALAEWVPQARIRPVLATVSRRCPPPWTRRPLLRCAQNKRWRATVGRYGSRYHAQVTVPNTKSRWTWHYISASRVILGPKSSTKTMTRSVGRRFNCASWALLAHAAQPWRPVIRPYRLRAEEVSAPK